MTLTIVRGPNLNYRILREDGFQIGDARKSLKGFSVFLKGIYFGLKNAPNRRAGSIGTRVERLKDVIPYVEEVLTIIEEADRKAAAAKNVLLENVIQVYVNQTPEPALNWLVAKALKLDVDIDNKGSYVTVVDGKTFDAVNDLPLLISIMNKHVQTLENIFSEKFEATSFGSGVIGTGNSIILASLRCFVIKELGGCVLMPACLLWSE